MIPEAEGSKSSWPTPQRRDPRCKQRGRTNRTSVNRWSAWTSRCRYAACKRRLGIGDEVKTVVFDGQRQLIVSRRVGKTVERKAVAARKAVGCRRRCRVMSMSDMCNRVHREGQQQCRESNSQPLRRSSGQMHQAHERQRTKVGRRHRLRTTTSTVKCAPCYRPGF
jgi:hypothetical protein